MQFTLPYRNLPDSISNHPLLRITVVHRNCPLIMPARSTSRKRRTSNRSGRLSFVFSRRSSSILSADTDASESYHHSRSNSAGRLPRRSSQRTSISSEASAASDSTSTIDPPTQANAVREAEEKKNSFRESLPQSLHAAHADRDCVAPFRRDEVSGYGR